MPEVARQWGERVLGRSGGERAPDHTKPNSKPKINSLDRHKDRCWAFLPAPEWARDDSSFSTRQMEVGSLRPMLVVTKTNNVECTSPRNVRAGNAKSMSYGRGWEIFRETEERTGETPFKGRKGFGYGIRKSKVEPSNTSITRMAR